MKYTVSEICNEYSISPQGYYKARKDSHRIEDNGQKLIEKVIAI